MCLLDGLLGRGFGIKERQGVLQRGDFLGIGFLALGFFETGGRTSLGDLALVGGLPEQPVLDGVLLGVLLDRSRGILSLGVEFI